MDTITLAGALGPVDALDLRSRLATATSELRPLVEVDLTDVTSMHVAAVAALIHGARCAQRQRGELLIRPPASPSARDTLSMASWFPPARLDIDAPR